jgi:NAD(P)-dependent dehydrogenase (short-subunit alcohol dehydrogenase family)
MIVLVTGASSGIGFSVAKVLASQGHHVYGTSRKANHGDVLEGFTLLKMDVRNEQSVREAVNYLISQESRIDVLINNAGLGLIGPVENTSDLEARDIFDTNVFGVLNVCRICLPHLRKSKNGYIFNITSMAAQIGLPYRGIYSASKFAVEGYTEALSMEVRRFGIKVCLIEPGDFKTNINSTRKVVAYVNKEVYGADYDRIMKQVDHEVDHSRTPEVIGYSIASILKQQKPRLRFRVATLMQRFSLTLMRVLPSRWFEKLLMNHYKMDK